MTEQRAPYGGQSEADFQRAVIELAMLTGWMVHHTRPAWTTKGYRTPIQGHPGFPDLCLIRGEWMILAELKSEKGKLSLEQLVWQEGLKRVSTRCPTVRYCVWWPSDWESITITLARS